MSSLVLKSRLKLTQSQRCIDAAPSLNSCTSLITADWAIISQDLHIALKNLLCWPFQSMVSSSSSKLHLSEDHLFVLHNVKSYTMYDGLSAAGL